FCRWARDEGAAAVLGIDVSQKMLARAAAMPDAAIAYTRADLERLELPAGSFDLVYSSLALHYIENLDGLFSVEHPIFTAPAAPGWSTDEAGRKTWPVDRYLDEGPRSTDWLAKGVIKQHR